MPGGMLKLRFERYISLLPTTGNLTSELNDRTKTYLCPYTSPIFVFDFVSEFLSNFLDDDRRLNVGELMIAEEKIYPFPLCIDPARSPLVEWCQQYSTRDSELRKLSSYQGRVGEK